MWIKLQKPSSAGAPPGPSQRSSRLVSVPKGPTFLPPELVPPLFKPKLRSCYHAHFVVRRLYTIAGKCIANDLIRYWHVTCVVTAQGQEVRMPAVRLDELLPATSDYVTYDGSLTQPGCQETVTWLLLNKPIYVTQRHVRVR